MELVPSVQTRAMSATGMHSLALEVTGKRAKAVTDVPTTVPEFISQRRRWLNGSFFASLHATLNFYKIWTSGHGFLRKIVLQFEFIYNAIQMLFAWISLANFYLSFFFLCALFLLLLYYATSG